MFPNSSYQRHSHVHRDATASEASARFGATSNAILCHSSLPVTKSSLPFCRNLATARFGVKVCSSLIDFDHAPEFTGFCPFFRRDRVRPSSIEFDRVRSSSTEFGFLRSCDENDLMTPHKLDLTLRSKNESPRIARRCNRATRVKVIPNFQRSKSLS